MCCGGFRLPRRFSGGGGSAAVQLFKSFVEKFLVGEAVSFHQEGDRLIAVEQILVNMGRPNLAQIFEEGQSHIFFEKTAEILPGETQLAGSILECDGLPVMGAHIGENGAEAVEGGNGGAGQAGRAVFGEKAEQAGEHLQDDPLGFHGESGDILHHVETGQGFHEPADLVVFRETFVPDILGNTVDPI